jgi:hypothetical protein
MKRSTRILVTSAAMAGLYAGAFAARTFAADESAGNSDHTTSLKASSSSTHSCAGKNSCKGQGGCSSSDNGCSGKNSCKGKGGCNTAG